MTNNHPNRSKIIIVDESGDIDAQLRRHVAADEVWSAINEVATGVYAFRAEAGRFRAGDSATVVGFYNATDRPRGRGKVIGRKKCSSTVVVDGEFSSVAIPEGMSIYTIRTAATS